VHAAPLGLLAAAGIFVSVLGVALPPATYLDALTEVRMQTGAPSWFAVTPDEAHFIPQFAPPLGHAWLLSHLLRHSQRFDAGAPFKLLIPNPPQLEDLLPKLAIDWLGRELTIRLLTAWLLLLCVAAVASAWYCRARWRTG
jgi:hypothetical protein